MHIAKDRDTNASRGFAFITFSSSTDCNKACSTMDGKVCYLYALLLCVIKFKSKPCFSSLMPLTGQCEGHLSCKSSGPVILRSLLMEEDMVSPVATL